MLIQRLKEKEARLGELTKLQGTNVDEFVSLVKENRETLEKMKVGSGYLHLLS